MRTHGHTTVWGTHIGIGRTEDAKRWYAHLKAWWVTHHATRQEARRAALNAYWDAQHETVRPLRAEAAPEMAAAQGAVSFATLFYGLPI